MKAKIKEWAVGVRDRHTSFPWRMKALKTTDSYESTQFFSL